MRSATSIVTTTRSSIAHRRSVRRDRHRLERELASYDTPAARLELDAILTRHTAAETAEVAAILRRQSAARLVGSYEDAWPTVHPSMRARAPRR